MLIGRLIVLIVSDSASGLQISITVAWCCLSRFSIFYDEILNIGTLEQCLVCSDQRSEAEDVPHLVKIWKFESIYKKTNKKIEKEMLSCSQLPQIFPILPGNLRRAYGKFSWKLMFKIWYFWQKICLPVSQASAQICDFFVVFVESFCWGSFTEDKAESNLQFHTPFSYLIT